MDRYPEVVERSAAAASLADRTVLPGGADLPPQGVGKIRAEEETQVLAIVLVLHHLAFLL